MDRAINCGNFFLSIHGFGKNVLTKYAERCRLLGWKIELSVSLQLKKLLVVCGPDVIKSILRDVNIGNIFFSPKKEVG